MASWGKNSVMMSCKYCTKVGALHPCIRHSICVSGLQLYPSRCSRCQENYARAKSGDYEALRHWRFRLSALKGHRRHRLRMDEMQARQIWGNTEERRCFGDLKDPMNEVEHCEEYDRRGTFNPYIFEPSSSSQYDARLSPSPTEFKPIKIESCISLAETPITPRGCEGSSLHQLRDPKIEIDNSQYSCVDDTPASLPSTVHSAIPGSGGRGLGCTSELSGLCLVKREVHCYSVLDQLMKDQTYTDVTITADGHTFYAHKIVLCVASSYFRRVLSDNSPGVRNVVVLRDISHTEMRNLLQFLYTGEATVEASDLPSFMRTAQMLEINSLSDGCLAPPFPPTSSSAPAAAAFTSVVAAFGTTAPSHQSYVPAAPQALSVVNSQFAFNGQPTTPATSSLPFGLSANAMRLPQSTVLLEKPRQALHLQQLQQQLQQQQHHLSPVLTPSLQEHSSSLIVPSLAEVLQVPKIAKICSEKARRPGRRRKQPITEPKVEMLPQSSNVQKQQPGQPCGTQQLQHKPEPRLVPQLIDHVVPEILAKALLRTPDTRPSKSPLVATLSSAEISGQHLACDTANGSGVSELTSCVHARPLSPPPSKSPNLCNGEQFKIKIRSVDSMTATDFDVAESVSSSGGSTTGFAVPESSIPTAENNSECGDQIGSGANVDCVPSVSNIENDLVTPPREVEGKGLDILANDTTASRLLCQGGISISENVDYSNCTVTNVKSVMESQSQESSSHSQGLSSLTERYQEDDVPIKRRKIADENE